MNLFFTLIFVNLIFLNSLFAQWYQLPNSPYHPGRFEDIYFINNETGWLLHSYGDVYKTINGGYSWTHSSIDSIAFYRSITAVNENLIFIGTLSSDNVLFSSTDGGLNWNEVTNIPSPQPSGLCGIFSLNEQYIFGCGKYDGPAYFIKSTDGGDSWTSKDMSQYANGLVDCYFFNKDSGLVVGSIGPTFTEFKSVLLFTSDGGETWVNRFTGDRTIELGWKISFPDRMNGYVSLERTGNTFKYFLKTTDGGETWNDFPFPQYNEQGCGFVNALTGWIGGNFNPTYGTTNGGTTWFNANIGEQINRFRFLNDSIGYACGRYVYKYDKTVGITPISTVIPEKYILHQNYPNPFNSSTNIKFGIQNRSFVSLHVYDILGRKISTLVNQELLPGSYEVNFSDNLINSGIYYYSLESGNLKEVKKMVLLK